MVGGGMLKIEAGESRALWARSKGVGLGVEEEGSGESACIIVRSALESMAGNAGALVEPVSISA